MSATRTFDHLPLRAQKKAITHAALVEAAQRRFLADGFAATTLEDICSDVRVHVRTLLRYFRTKEELALAPEFESLEQLESTLANRGDRRVLDVFRDRLDEVAEMLQHDPQVIRYTHFVLGEPALAALRSEVLRQHEDVLYEALREEVGAGRRKTLRARLLAAMLIGGMRSVASRWVAREPDLNLRKAFGEVVDEAQGAFEEWRR
jgi:AcrR family transcriptional regulator